MMRGEISSEEDFKILHKKKYRYLVPPLVDFLTELQITIEGIGFPKNFEKNN